jgi:hypothetical protein
MFQWRSRLRSGAIESPCRPKSLQLYPAALSGYRPAPLFRVSPEHGEGHPAFRRASARRIEGQRPESPARAEAACVMLGAADSFTDNGTIG